MKTSQYDAATRKEWKRVQRSPAYQVLRNRLTEERAKLLARDAVIARLKERLRLSGMPFEEVERLAA
jgi:hypothetical protein